MGRYETQGDLAANSLLKVVGNSGDVRWLPGSPRPDSEGDGPGGLRVGGIRRFPLVAR